MSWPRAIWAMLLLRGLVVLPFLRRVEAAANRTILGPSSAGISPSQWPYDFQNNYCRLITPSSVLIGKTLVIDGGVCKFQLNVTGRVLEIPELNGYMTSIDLSSDFDLSEIPYIDQVRRPKNVPPVSRGALWVDSTNRYVFDHGGHFYDSWGYNESDYFVKDADIPPYNLWRYDTQEKKWEDMKPGGDTIQRAVAGAKCSIPKYNLSFYLGSSEVQQLHEPANADFREFYSGELTLRSQGPAFYPPGLNLTQPGMIIYNHTTNTLKNISMENSFGKHEGFYHGQAVHLPIGKKMGLLLALFGEKYKLQEYFPTNLTGNPASFDYIMLYDIAEDRWYNQSTTYYNNELPTARSRFCSVLVQDTNSARNPFGSWELWVYGGQTISGINQKNLGVDDIWVLTMPSFTWIKVTDPLAGDYRRGHVCHALGSQLVVIGGGHPDGQYSNQEDVCEKNLIKVFDLSDMSWRGSFTADTNYTQPNIVKKAAIASEPREGWIHTALAESFKFTPTPTPTDKATDKPSQGKKPTNKNLKIGLSVGLPVGLLILCGALLLLFRSYRSHHPSSTPGHGKPTGPVPLRPIAPQARDDGRLFAEPTASHASASPSSPNHTDANTSTKSFE